jgi:hypothetical protein
MLVLVGAVLVVVLRRWRKICTILQPMGNKGQYLKKCPKKTLLTTKKQGNLGFLYTPLTLLSQLRLALTTRKTFFALKIIGAPKQINA